MGPRSSPLRGRSITTVQVARRKAYVLLSGGESPQITQRAHTPGVNSPARAVFHLHLTKCQLIFHAVLSNPPAGRERRHNVSVRFISFLGPLETVRRKLKGGVGWGGGLGGCHITHTHL